MTTDRTTEEQHMTEQQTPTPLSRSNTAASAGVGGTRGRGGADGGGEDASGAVASRPTLYGWSLEGWYSDLTRAQAEYAPAYIGGHFLEQGAGGCIVADWRINPVSREWQRTGRPQ